MKGLDLIMKYEAPVVAIEILNTEDVVLVSNVKLEVKDDGGLKVVDWNDIV